MARIRTVKPEIHTDDKTGTLSDHAFRLFVGLLNLADDYGVIAFSLAEYKAKLFPYQTGDAVDVVGTSLFDELLPSGIVMVFFYSPEDEDPLRTYLWIPNFLRHQRVNRPSSPLIPGWGLTTTPSNFGDAVHVGTKEEWPDAPKVTDGADSGSTHGGLSEGSGSTHARKGKEGKGREPSIGSRDEGPPPFHSAQKRARPISKDFTPSADMLAWAAKMRPHVDVQYRTLTFINHAVANGRELVEWEPAWKNWILDDKHNGNGSNGQSAGNGHAPEPTTNRSRGWDRSRESYEQYQARTQADA